MRKILKVAWRAHCLAWKLGGATACILIGAKGLKDVWDEIN